MNMMIMTMTMATLLDSNMGVDLNDIECGGDGDVNQDGEVDGNKGDNSDKGARSHFSVGDVDNGVMLTTLI